MFRKISSCNSRNLSGYFYYRPCVDFAETFSGRLISAGNGQNTEFLEATGCFRDFASGGLSSPGFLHIA